jgi:hypothetical protein
MANIVPVEFFDVRLMSGALNMRHSAHFFDDQRRQQYPGSPHHATRAIILRGPEGYEAASGTALKDLWFADVPHHDSPLLDDWPIARNLLERLAASQEFGRFLGHVPKFGKVMLVSLPPGGWIEWHVDQGAYADAHDRFHLPIDTCPGAWLFSGGESAGPVQGILSYFNNHIPHSAVNVGPADRVHMIIDTRRVPRKDMN